MKTPLRVGITGGIGVGKSMVSKIFQALGVPVYDSDRRARELMSSDQFLVSEIKAKLGADSYLPDGSLNRNHLSKVVFQSPDKIKTLNGIVHPRVAEDFEAWSAERRSTPYLMKEAALLFESGSNKELDSIIVVTAPESLRIARVLQRDPQRNEAGVRDIIRNQLGEPEKIGHADFVIQNDETIPLIPQVVVIDGKLRESFARK